MKQEQTKLLSFLESLFNVFLGFIFAFLTQIIIFPLFDIQVSFVENFYITIIFTLVSFVRLYLIRRFFETKINVFLKKIAEFLKKL